MSGHFSTRRNSRKPHATMPTRPGAPKGYFLGGLFSGTPGTSSSYQTSNTNVNFDPTYTSLLHKTLNRTSDVMDTPYKPYEGNRVTDFNTDQNAAFQGVRDAQGNWQPYTTQAGGSLDRATGMDPNASAQPWLNRAANTSTATRAANPYMRSASETLPQGIDPYMSDYTDAVVNRIGDLGARNLTEKLLPGVNDVFTGAQFGRDRHADFTNRAVRDTQESILGQQSQALESGYKTAGDLFNADKNRAAGLAGQAGQLASTDLTNAAGLASTSAGITGAAKAGDIALGQAQAGLGQTVQGAEARDNTALATSGGMQQQQGQREEDWNYQQFQDQKNYPMQMLDWAKSMGQGWQLPSSTNSTSFGQQTQQAPQGSPFGQILGGLTSAIGAIGGVPGLGQLGSMFGGSPTLPGSGFTFKKGGPVGHFATGGHAMSVNDLRAGAMRRQQQAPQGPAPVMRARGGHFAGKRNYAEGGEVQLYSPNPRAPTSYGGPDIEVERRPKPRDPVSMLWNSLPPNVRKTYRHAGDLMLDFSPPAIIRDMVNSSGDLGQGMIEGDPERMLEGASGMGFGALGLIPGAGLVPRAVRGATRGMRR